MRKKEDFKFKVGDVIRNTFGDTYTVEDYDTENPYNLWYILRDKRGVTKVGLKSVIEGDNYFTKIN